MLGRLTQADVCVLLEALVAVGYLEQVEINSFRPVLQVTPSGLGVMKGTEPLRARLPLPPDVLARIGGNPAATPSAREPVSLPKADASQTAAPGILEALKQWRRGEAEGSGVPPHYVMSNATLEELSRSRPRTRDALLEVHGIVPKKLERYGQALLTILQHGDEPVEPRDRQPEIVPPVRREPPLPPPSKGRAVAPDPIDGWFEDGEPDAAPSDATLVPRGESLTNITTQAATSKNAVEPCLRPSYYWTWRLFEGGFTWPECAAIRRLRREEIVDHLLQAVEDGYRVRAAWCLAPELLARLAELVPVGE